MLRLSTKVVSVTQELLLIPKETAKLALTLVELVVDFYQTNVRAVKIPTQFCRMEFVPAPLAFSWVQMLFVRLATAPVEVVSDLPQHVLLARPMRISSEELASAELDMAEIRMETVYLKIVTLLVPLAQVLLLISALLANPTQS